MAENVEAIIYELADLEESQAHDKGNCSRKQKTKDPRRLQIYLGQYQLLSSVSPVQVPKQF